MSKREDYEYRREGARNPFLFCEPLAGWRHVAVTQRRTTEDFAHQMLWLVDEAHPQVPVVRLALDNLNTHRRASLYQTFPAAEARRIVQRLEFHYTPKHGSWLNMAGIEFSVSPTRNPSAGRSMPWNWSGTRLKPASTGASTSSMPAPSSIDSIPLIPDLTRY